MSSPSSASEASHKEQQPAQSTLYRVVMTPIIFVSFLFSLALVELRYSMLRSHHHDRPPHGHSHGHNNATGTNNADANSSGCTRHRMPEWLHHIVYRRQPYHYVLVKDDSQPVGGAKTTTAGSTRSTDDGTYYHSMQRKLLKMETDEAFRIRTTVLFVMGVTAVGSVWASMVAVKWVARHIWA
ncbi:hypothetical protein SEUCBS139899_008411 [Sporothrix eucalyptigena]|uniref:Uncharacterized protein n=1 Tax=Sporothrix eucalyptigena TaxID=1812306 RepID=A0ABP0D281_9PEZI